MRGGILQRTCACGQHAGGGECEECRQKKERLQRRKGNETEPAGVPSIVHEVLRSSGRPLDAAARGTLEPRFGYDFSQVRVHTDARSAESAQAVNALAYTVGRDVVFGAGRYAPQTSEGRRLIAHELTHVVQQQGLSGGVRQHLTLGPTDDPYEREAERIASAVTRTETPGSGDGSVKALPALRLQNASALQRDTVPTGIVLKESKPLGHADLGSDEDKKKYRTCIGAITLMGVTPAGDYTAGQKKGDCVREFLTEVSNTCPAHAFCASEKCLEIGRYGTAGDGLTHKTVTDGPDTFIDRHVSRMKDSFLEGSGKNACSVVCHQRYKYRTEADKSYHDLGSFYIIRNFRADKYTPQGSKDALHITTGEIQKVPAGLEAPTKEKFAKDVAPGLKKSGSLTDAPPVPQGLPKGDEKK
jgi:hypothetical protein